ncbi:hypothetical protein AKJ16_DCAP10673 [Drosera capensis]
MERIVHDYEWEGRFEDPDVAGSCGEWDGGFVRSSLVVILSSVCRDLKEFCGFVGVDEGVGDRLLRDRDAFCEKFGEIFGHVRDAFDHRDIHFSWIHVEDRMGSDDSQVDGDECSRLLEVFRSGIRRLGWGFCSSESIDLGSALVPFGLIYPMIGFSTMICELKDESCGKVVGKLNLEILDVSGNPLDLGCCDLQLHEMKKSRKCNLIDVAQKRELTNLVNECSELARPFWGLYGDGVNRIVVLYVGKYGGNVKSEGSMFNTLLVHEFPEANKEKSAVLDNDFFADRLLQMLSKRDANQIVNKSPPTWQILLSYLYRRNYSALVSLSNPNGNICMGILKPLTLWSAMLSVIKSEDGSSAEEHDFSKQSLFKFGFDVDLDSSNRMLSSEKRRQKKNHSHIYKDLSWSAFCKAAYEGSELDLEAAYFSKKYDKSKKLKFIRCWMKEVDKGSFSRVSKQDRSAPNKEDPEAVLDRLCQVHEESEQPLASCFLATQNNLLEPCRLDVITHAAPAVAPEDFFNNLCDRIEHGIQSGLDLVALAHRLVESCILCLNNKLQIDDDQGSQASIEKFEGSGSSGAVVAELIKLLLKDPKDLAGKQRDDDQPSNMHDARHNKFSSEEKVREYELQILFRLEMLQSDVADGIKPSMKQKLVRQICSLLEMVQYNVEGGVLGNFNLNDYVGKMIVSRYSQNLGDVIHSIYEQLDMFFFNEEDESPNPLLKSEDSNQSWGTKPGRGDERLSNSHSTYDSLSQHPRDNNGGEKGSSKEDYDLRLAEAREKRQRACRFSSFTRGMADLRRVWAPKQPKLSRSASDTRKRRSMRKGRRLESYDSVSETPMTANKRPCSPGSSNGSLERQEPARHYCSSVYKSLFQDED